ncbi:uncharacterized protein LOC115482946 [Drosophila hydei]|uniref:Uncharacterized protein LOC115482946 n=1 Tax=Drosophila hydei TaxID=7224 RepID=A0A6J2SSW6_DROHY|nr:uncharacterized protein LOC115482946 [Drosophila hydei]
MTLSHWYRDKEMEPRQEKSKSKLASHIQQLDMRLQSIVLENNANKLLRQQAGLDKVKLSSKTNKKKLHRLPTVCHTQKLYDRNRQQELRQMQKIQRQQCQFHSHPVPDFKAMHRRWEIRNKSRQRHSTHNLTKPVTPQTLIKSMESAKRWRANRAVLERSKMKEVTLKPQLSQSSENWRQPPFVPRILSSIVKTEPFQLKSVERGKLRKQFDLWHMRKQEKRWQRRADEWAQRCHNEYVEARKLTHFKATPNPWKRIKAQI